MPSRKHKSQHFVPASYLRAWRDPNSPPDQEPYVWCFARGSRRGRKRAPQNVCHETDFYTIVTEDGERDLQFEHALGYLESNFVRIRDQTIAVREPLSEADRFLLCVFVAAMHARTRQMRDHLRSEWGRVLELGDRIQRFAETATPEQLRSLSSFHTSSHPPDRMSLDDVRTIVAHPAPTALREYVSIELPFLLRMSMAVLCTDTSPGFITSDAPCVWVDPEHPERPVGLAAGKLEITLSLSPARCLLLTWQALDGYHDVQNERVLNELNRRTHLHCDDYYIVSRNESRASWFSRVPPTRFAPNLAATVRIYVEAASHSLVGRMRGLYASTRLRLRRVLSRLTRR